MKYKQLIYVLLLGSLIYSCKGNSELKEPKGNSTLTIAFGSCNKQELPNVLWEHVIAHQPDAWIWGGDVIYADSDDPKRIEEGYQQEWEQKGYKELSENTKILGTWDDHDYGLNDGGEESPIKAESQKLFLDFLKVPENDIRRQRQGVYHSEILDTEEGSVKIIILDTRYFRSSLTVSTVEGKRYMSNTYGEGTVLGEIQWTWFEEELNSSQADFNVIVSSVQLLSNEHGFETWGNFPHEVDKMKTIISNSSAKGILVLSGDRHISEFSKTKVQGLSYPLIDFTSSGLTHSYTSFDDEPNPFREGKVISDISFGVLNFDFKSKTVRMQMRGKNNVLLQELIQQY